MKIMSIDYGDARTGIAFCDKNEILATAFTTISESYQPKLVEKIKEIIEKLQKENDQLQTEVNKLKEDNEKYQELELQILESEE